MQIASGANAKEVRTVMGHSDIQRTFNLYGHLFPDDADARGGNARRRNNGATKRG